MTDLAKKARSGRNVALQGLRIRRSEAKNLISFRSSRTEMAAPVMVTFSAA